MRVSTALATTLAIAVVAARSAQAIQLLDGTVYFAYPPQLVAATTTFEAVNVRGSTYYFTLSIPENAGENLQRVTITQREGIQEINLTSKIPRLFWGHKGTSGSGSHWLE